MKSSGFDMNQNHLTLITSVASQHEHWPPTYSRYLNPIHDPISLDRNVAIVHHYIIITLPL